MLVRNFLLATIFSSTAIHIAGCVQYPTERQNVVDLRPQISFKVDMNDSRMTEARVFVDGLESGRLGDFLDGRGSLRLIHGSHTVLVINGNEILLNERTYLGDGISKPFIVK